MPPVSTGKCFVCSWGRNGEFCVAVSPVNRSTGVLAYCMIVKLGMLLPAKSESESEFLYSVLLWDNHLPLCHSHGQSRYTAYRLQTRPAATGRGLRLTAMPHSTPPFNGRHPLDPWNYMDHYSFTNPGGMEGWVGLVGWPEVKAALLQTVHSLHQSSPHRILSPVLRLLCRRLFCLAHFWCLMISKNRYIPDYELRLYLQCVLFPVAYGS